MRGAPLLGPRIQRPTHPSALANLRSSIKMSSDLCPASAPFFGFMGAAVALIFASAYQCRPSNLHGRAARGVPVAPRAETGPARPRRPGWAPHLAPITPLPQLPICCRRRFPLSHVWLCPLDASTDLGAAYGTAKSGVGVSSMGVMKPDLVMKSIIPVVMAGVLGIYGLIIAVIIANGGTPACLKHHAPRKHSRRPTSTAAMRGDSGMAHIAPHATLGTAPPPALKSLRTSPLHSSSPSSPPSLLLRVCVQLPRRRAA